jgi:mannosyltransferase OCH1-like enzyme
MPIPKILYQTWDTNMFPRDVKKRFIDMREFYKGYEYRFFLDEDMDNFVEENYPGEIWECYSRLNIIVAKADFWRYLILYKHGGIYLDMDSCINKPLDELINDDDDAIITAEGNPDLFVQWALMFKAGHPILKIVIDLVVDNIKNNKYPNDIHKMTGPSVFTEAIQILHSNIYKERIIHANIKQGTDITYNKNDVKYRIFGVDYDSYLSCKIPECFSLFAGRKKWHQIQHVTPLLKEFSDII